MTTTTMSGETASAAASPNEAPRVTAWDNIGDDASSNDEPLPPSIPPANRHIAEPLPPSIPPQGRGVEGQNTQDADERIASPTDMDVKEVNYGTVSAPGDYGLVPYRVKVRSSGPNLPGNIIDTRFAQNAGEQTSADAGMSYEDRGRQIIAGATERAKAGGKELFGRAKAGIKGIADKIVGLARGGAKTAGEAVAKGASVAVGFAAIEGPRAAKAAAEKASEVKEKSAQAIHELAESARSRREERKNKRAAAKAEREREYGKRQQARKKKLGEIAARAQSNDWIEARIKAESDERDTNIDTLEADISEQKDALEMKEEEVRAAESRARKAQRQLERLEAKKKKAEARRDEAERIKQRNPGDIDAEMALTRAEGDLNAIEEQYNAASTIKTRLEGKKVDLSSELGTTRTRLGELQGQVNVAEDEIAAGKKWLRRSRVERLENAASSAFTRVAEFVDGPTAAHGLLRRAGQAIRRKLQGSGNRQEAKTA